MQESEGCTHVWGELVKRDLLVTVPTATSPPRLDPATPDRGTEDWRCLTREQDRPPGSGTLGERPFLLASSLKAVPGEVEGRS